MRACDCCRARKVKCNSKLPCQGCVASKLTCTYDHVPRKKGPKVGGKSASILNKLRLGLDHAVVNVPKPREKLSWTVVSTTLLHQSMKMYFDNHYPGTPVLDRALVYSYLDKEPSAETFSVVMSIVAVCMGDLADRKTTTAEAVIQNTLQLIAIVCDVINGEELAFLTRADFNRRHNVTINSLATLFNFYVAFSQLEMPSRAFYFLRRAITEAQTAGIDNESFYESDPSREPFRAMFWCLFVAERGFALRHSYPTCLCHHLPQYPQSDDDENLVGLTQQVKSFSVFSPIFFKMRKAGPVAHHPETVQRLVDHFHSNQASPFIPCSDVQRAHILITDQWIRLQLWKLNPGELQQLADIGECLIAITESLPITTIQVHGSALMLKIYDIGMALATTFETPAQADHYGVSNHLQRIFIVMSQLQSTQHLSLLLETSQKLLPKLVDLKQEESSQSQYESESSSDRTPLSYPISLSSQLHPPPVPVPPPQVQHVPAPQVHPPPAPAAHAPVPVPPSHPYPEPILPHQFQHLQHQHQPPILHQVPPATQVPPPPPQGQGYLYDNLNPDMPPGEFFW